MLYLIYITVVLTVMESLRKNVSEINKGRGMFRESQRERQREREREGANEAAVTSTWLVSAMTRSSSGDSDNDDHNIGIR